jgi:hypothetical protein
MPSFTEAGSGSRSLSLTHTHSLSHTHTHINTLCLSLSLSLSLVLRICSGASAIATTTHPPLLCDSTQKDKDSKRLPRQHLGRPPPSPRP